MSQRIAPAAPVTAEPQLTHVNQQGSAHMVDISGKGITQREAVASGFIHLLPATLSCLRQNQLKKGDALAVARIAAIQAAKQTSLLIPLCHPLPLTSVAVEIELTDQPDTGARITATCRTTGQTGVEMEALTAVSVGCLTIYDMCKAIDPQMQIDQIYLQAKIGGKRDFSRSSADGTSQG